MSKIYYKSQCDEIRPGDFVRVPKQPNLLGCPFGIVASELINKIPKYAVVDLGTGYTYGPFSDLNGMAQGLKLQKIKDVFVIDPREDCND